MRVRDIMQGPVEALCTDATLRDAAFLFRRQRVQGARVMDSHGQLAGIFTLEELMQALANGAAMSDTVALHTRSVFCTVHPDTDISEIDWQGSRFLVVLDADAVVGGIDTMTVLEAAYGARQSGDMPYHQIFQGLPEPVFLVDSHWSVGWHNVAAGLLCSRASTDLCGQKLAEVLQKAGFDLEVDPADGQSIHMAWRDSVRLLPIIWRVNTDNRPLGFMVLLRNVQDQMIRSRELTGLRDLSAEQHAIIDSSFDGFYITDGEGRTLRINRVYERITGIRANEVLGKTMAELVDAGFYNESVTLRVLKSRRTETIIQKVKDTKTIVVTGTPVLDHEGNIWRVVTNVRDVTELRKLQAELERMARLQHHYRKELDTLRRHMDHKAKVIIRSKSMQEVYEQAMRLAQVDSTVLILGESGVGKEVVAELIHESSTRQEHPFVKVSCAAIPEHLLESELFGYKPGAFTGALRTGKSVFLRRPTTGPCFWMRSAKCPSDCRPRCCACCRIKVFPGWAACTVLPWTSGLLRAPTGI